MNSISAFCKSLGVRFNLDKTVIVLQTAPENSYVELAVSAEGTILKSLPEQHTCSYYYEIYFRLKIAGNSYLFPLGSGHGITSLR